VGRHLLLLGLEIGITSTAHEQALFTFGRLRSALGVYKTQHAAGDGDERGNVPLFLASEI
jgi:hypothetical protein